jgi:hypothetical protein
MFLRFLRLSARLTLVGTILSFILVPVYATGEATGNDTEAFNQLTLARVGQGSNRLWVTLACWYIFIAFLLREIWNEWRQYGKYRYDFLAKGDIDSPPEFRYSVRVENIPPELRSNAKLRAYFERLFPNQVRQTSICLYASTLDTLVAERKIAILQLEKAIAFTRSKPDKPAPVIKADAKWGCCGGTKVEAIPYLRNVLRRLNEEIDSERGALYQLADTGTVSSPEAIPETKEESHVDNGEIGINREIAQEGGPTTNDEIQTDGKPSSTGYLTLTSLRAKQAAVQCEISGKKDCMDLFPVSLPSSVIWQNVTVPLTQQRLVELGFTCFWTVGIVFWAVPVSIATGFANLNGILQALGLPTADPNAAWYGIVAGLLPVIALAILMAVLYICLNLAASKGIRKKSMTEVDAYALFWHLLFQFANLWLILIGGSLFNQLESLLRDPSEIVHVIATAIPGASMFFMNLIIMGSFGSWGLDLSMLVAYGVSFIMRLIQPEAQRTQRMLDDAKKPQSIVWGQRIPPMVFVFLVSVLYMPIVPLVEVFTLIYFGGGYIVWKHLCLHVYATGFEGGGSTTWESFFGFLMGAIYTAEIVFIAYVGLKETPVQAGMGFVPFIITVLMHYFLNRNIRKPLRNLSLEVAAFMDELTRERRQDKESVLFSESIEQQVYGQPSLKPSMDERQPLPYRRDEPELQNAENGIHEDAN